MKQIQQYASSDPYFSYVVHLCHFDVALGSGPGAALVNSCSRGTTLNLDYGNLLAPGVFGPYCLKRPSGGLGSQSGADTGTHADYRFGTADFTIEFWHKITSLSNCNIYDQRSAVGVAACPTIYVYSTGSVGYFRSGVEVCATAAGKVTAGTWNAIAVTRSGTTLRIFVNGVLSASGTDSVNYNSTDNCIGLGSKEIGQANEQFWDELRVTNGYCRYTTNYTLATNPFPNQ